MFMLLTVPANTCEAQTEYCEIKIFKLLKLNTYSLLTTCLSFINQV